MPEWDERLLAAWPDGVLAGDAALLRSLPRQRRDLTMARLAAVLDAEAGGDLSALAQRLGIDRVAFFRMRQRWARERSIRSLTPFATRAIRSIASGHLQPLVELALDRLRRDPDVPVQELAGQIRDSHGASISNQTVLRIAREARLALSSDLDHLTSEMGKQLLADLCGTAIEYRLEDGSVGTLAVAIVVEVASRLVLGAAAGDPREGLGLQLEAALAARRAFAQVIASDGPPSELVLVVPPGIEPFFPSSPVGMSLVARGERRFGQRLVSLVGHRFGRLQLRPRKTTSVPRVEVRSDTPEIGVADGAVLATAAIEEYNAKRAAGIVADAPGVEEARGALAVIDLCDADGSRRAAMAHCLDGAVIWLERLAQQEAKIRALKRPVD